MALFYQLKDRNIYVKAFIIYSSPLLFIYNPTFRDNTTGQFNYLLNFFDISEPVKSIYGDKLSTVG